MKNYLKVKTYEEAVAKTYNAECFDGFKNVDEYLIDQSNGVVILSLNDGTYYTDIFGTEKSGTLEEVDSFISEELKNEGI